IKKSFEKANKVFCVSRFTQKEIFKKINLKNTLVINNGVDYNKWQIDNPPHTLKEKMILGVGALKPRKGYHISIPSIVTAKKKYSNLKYYLVGDQSDKNYFNQLKELVREHNLKNNVIFLEKISDNDLIKLYHQANLFLLTPVNINSNFEGFGLVYLEANACGKPVIGTYGCGAEEAITDRFNGLLVPQNNIEKTSQAILSVLDNPVLAEELSQNGLNQAQKMDWSNMVEQYIKVYEDFYKEL
ncbi:glycosyltransferase family 4 protein, partial [Patescibacteria group bacterium]|nr:glycosyltransferase family 4 protein [Patescibacteria group bacterium]